MRGAPRVLVVGVGVGVVLVGAGRGGRGGAGRDAVRGGERGLAAPRQGGARDGGPEGGEAGFEVVRLARGRGVGGLASLGVGGFLVVLVLSLVFGVDLFTLLGVQSPLGGSVGGGAAPGITAPGQGAGDEEMVAFVSAVLDDSQATWAGIFAENNITYDEAQLSLEDGDVSSACGTVPAAAGPFYCPLDEVVYLNFAFYDALRSQYGASGDFAQAYVIAHEVGHHVQAELGVAQRVGQLRERAGQAESNALSVRLELQADCFAGVWARRAHEARGILERGDIEEGLGAAAAVGDDRLQRRARGEVVPESFTHGSSAQRVRWFRTGLGSGDIRACDTFETGRS